VVIFAGLIHDARANMLPHSRVKDFLWTTAHIFSSVIALLTIRSFPAEDLAF